MRDAETPRLPAAIILCGGAGSRLRSVTGTTPKSLASVADRPFLELLLRQLQRHGFGRVVLAVGYRQEAIRDHFGDRAMGLEIAYSSESSPLGTGGAIRNALVLTELDTVLVMNGDSYTDLNLLEFIRDHRDTNADASVVVVPMQGRTDCGSVVMNDDRRIVKFEEKQPQPSSVYVNAGVYLLHRTLFLPVEAGAEVSLEKELFPRWIAEGGSVHAFVQASECIDIGTPERYQSAQQSLAAVETAEFRDHADLVRERR